MVEVATDRGMHIAQRMRTHSLRCVEYSAACSHHGRNIGDAICCAASFPGSSQPTLERGNEAILCSMPKKFKGVNTKAEAARERKQTAKAATDEKKRQQEEDEYWRDDDKHVARKEQRKVATIQFNYRLPSATSYSHSLHIHCEVSLISVGFIPLMHSQHTG